MKTGKMIARGESGFTLVEIAVVIIIVGLLVGGILKGQALVENSRVSTIVSQVGAIKAAAYTFHDKYNQFPGDMANATTAIPQCDAAHLCINGNGSGYIADDPGGCCNVWTTILTSGAGMGGSDFESIQFWKHMALTGIMTGLDPNGNVANPKWGVTHPVSAFGGGYEVYYDAINQSINI